MNNKDIDIFIISYNRLSYLTSLVLWLEKAGFNNIHIVDNASTYQPLLTYLSLSKHKVYRMDKNWGHLVVWECGQFQAIIDNKKYIVTDCDILPIKECPLNLTEYFSEILGKYPKVTKVGFGLKIDDLPEHNLSKNAILEWEKQFWQKKTEEGLYDASIDTTFALYRPGIYPTDKKWWKSIRTDFPYIAQHLPWYNDSNKQSEEDVFYQNSIQNKDSFWSVIDVELLKKYNKELLAELENVYNSRKWKILQVTYKFLNIFSLEQRFARRIGKKNTSSVLDTDDVIILQKSNKALVVELGSIKSSGGWIFLQKVENLFD